MVRLYPSADNEATIFLQCYWFAEFFTNFQWRARSDKIFFCLNLQLNRSMMSLKDTKKSPPIDEKVIHQNCCHNDKILEHAFERRGKTLFKFKSNSKYCLYWRSLTWKIWMQPTLNHKLERSSKMSQYIISF